MPKNKEYISGIHSEKFYSNFSKSRMTFKRGNIFLKLRITQGILQLQSSPASDMKLTNVYRLVHYENNVLYRKHTLLIFNS